MWGATFQGSTLNQSYVALPELGSTDEVKGPGLGTRPVISAWLAGDCRKVSHGVFSAHSLAGWK